MSFFAQVVHMKSLNFMGNIINEKVLCYDCSDGYSSESVQIVVQLLMLL